MLTQAELQRLFNYDPANGVFTRRVRTTNSVQVGDVAGSLHHSGYLHIQIRDKIHAAHRLAWMYMTGSFPSHDVDHINGCRADNRWENLREASDFDNAKNAKRRADNTSGFRGVSFCRSRSTWVARCQVDGKRKCIGYFKTQEAAGLAYQAFAREHHKEFYRDTIGSAAVKNKFDTLV